MNRILAVTACLLSALLAAGADPVPAPAQTAELSRHFGFGPMQIYRLKSGIRLLELADLDGDGRTDILLWNPHDSRIELFYQRDADSAPEGRRALDRNELPDRGDMHNERLPVSYQVSAMCVAELTGDGRPDLVFFGEPREIVILPGQPDGGFGPPSGLRAPEGEPRAGFLCVGDFNSDGLTDVALLGREVLQIYHQQPGGGLAQPLRLVHGITDPMLMLTTDINGDGRDDLAIVVDDVQYAMNVYLQGPDGTLSALQRVKIPRLRSATFVPVPGGDHLFAIEAATRRLTQYVWQARTDGVVELDWPQQLYSYPVAVKARRIPFTLGDVTNNGLVDCVAADPDAAQLFLFPGLPDGLGAGKAFPGLAKTTDLLIADLDGDGQAELVSVSAQERTLGVSRFEHGRLTFPQPLPTPGTPLAVTAGRLRPTDERPHLAIAFRPVAADEQRTDDGDDEDEDDYADERGSAAAGIHISLVDTAMHRELRRWPVPDLKEDPSGLRLADVNQDGRNDLIVFSHFNPPQVFLQAEDGQFRLLTGFATRASLVREARLPSFDLADVTGDGQAEVLLAQQGLARALRVEDGAWTVVDQYNPEAAGEWGAPRPRAWPRGRANPAARRWPCTTAGRGKCSCSTAARIRHTASCTRCPSAITTWQRWTSCRSAPSAVPHCSWPMRASCPSSCPVPPRPLLSRSIRTRPKPRTLNWAIAPSVTSTATACATSPPWICARATLRFSRRCRTATSCKRCGSRFSKANALRTIPAAMASRAKSASPTSPATASTTSWSSCTIA